MPKVTITEIRPLAGEVCQKSKAERKEGSAVFYWLAVSLTIAISVPAPAGAGDFKHARKLYVPPTQIERRMDFSLLREHQAAIEAHSPAVVSASPLKSSSPSSAGKYGLIPPPPPIVPRLTAGSVVPPPPLPSSAFSPGKIAALKNAASRALSSPAVASTIQRVRQKAAALSAEGKFEEAQQILNRALKLSPSDKAVLKQLASVSCERAKQFIDSSDFDNALRSARQALSLDPSSQEAPGVLNQVLTKTGVNPGDPSQRLKTAELLASQGKNTEATVEYAQALKLKPSASAEVGLGNMALRANQKDSALQHYQQALELEPNSAIGHRQMGLFRYASGDIVGANAELSRSLILDPKDETAGSTLVELWQHQVSKVPGANSHLGLARAYLLAGNLQSAQSEYRTVVRVDPENPNLPAARQAFKLALSRQEADKDVEAARTLESQGALAPAFQKVSEAVSLSPGDAAIRLYQGQLLEKLGQSDAARDAYMRVLKEDPHNILAAARLKVLAEERPVLPPAVAQMPPQQLQPAATTAEAPALSIPPPGGIRTHDPVANISGFATALRNHMMVSKNQLQQVEDAAHKIISQIGAPPANEELHSAVPAIASSSGSVVATTASAAAAVQPAPGQQTAAAGDGLSTSIANVLSSAATAISAARGLTPAAQAAPAASATSAGAAFSASQGFPAPATSQSAPAAAQTDSNLLPAFPKLNAAYKHLSDLQQQNRKLQEQINRMNEAIQRLKVNNDGQAARQDAAPVSPDPAPSVVKQVLPPTAAPPINKVNFDAAQVATFNLPPAAVLPANSTPAYQSVPYTPVASAQTAASYNPASAGLGSYPSTAPYPLAPGPAAVRLELAGAQPKLDGVHLDVILKNDADSPLAMPSRVKAVIKYNNRQSTHVHVAFAGGTVPPHGEIHGTIKVPFDKVDPTADLLIPDLLPEGAGSRDVHLTTSISLR